MKILHFVESLDATFGGPVRAIVDLAAALVEIGHTVTIVTTDSSSGPAEWSDAGDRPKVLSIGKPGLFGLALSPSAREALSKEMQSADVVHAHGVWCYASILVCRLAARFRKPFVISPHGMLDEWPMRQKSLKKRVYLALVGSRWLSGASQVHLAASLEFEQARRWFPGDLGIVVPNLLDTAPFQSLPEGGIIEPALRQLDPRRGRVLFLSRLHPKKGLEILLRASALLKARQRPVSIIVAGEGASDYVAALADLARELGLEDDELIFLGAVAGDRKLALFRSCDVFALPTHHENFGYVLVEALACGLCVVTTRAVAIASELQSTGAAVLAEATPEQFAEAIDHLMADRNASRARGEMGRQRTLEWLDAGRIIRQYERMYSRCAGEVRD